ncbi:MAG: MBL fold metallo-hydrolase [Chloroflexota bacterium]
MTNDIFNRREYLSKYYRPPKNFSPADTSTKVVILGSGNPFPNPLRRGPCSAVIANGIPYFVDAGEGIWRSIAHAVTYHPNTLSRIFSLEKLRYLFVTHLHADHTIGIPSFLLSPYKFNAPFAKEIYGPIGMKHMVEHILTAYEVDIDGAWKRSGHNPIGWQANVHEILEPGLVFEDENVRIEAFRTQHAPLDHCWAFRFTTQDRIVVVGGDGRYSQSLVQAVVGADIFVADIVSEVNLIHAPWGGELADKAKTIQRHHLLPRDLVSLQKKSGVKTIVTYHEQSFMPEDSYYREGLADEIKQLSVEADLFSSVDGDIF